MGTRKIKKLFIHQNYMSGEPGENLNRRLQATIDAIKAFFPGWPVKFAPNGDIILDERALKEFKTRETSKSQTECERLRQELRELVTARVIIPEEYRANVVEEGASWVTVDRTDD